MKVVVAGGTGFVGRHVARALLSAGHEVAVLTRTPDKIARVDELDGAVALRGDVVAPWTLRDVLSGWDAVVAAVTFPGYPAEVQRRGLTFDRYDRGGTENLLAEARRSGMKRFVYISGAGADPGSTRTWYAAKGRAEAAIRASEVPYSILRPSWAYGPGDRAVNTFAAMARFSPVVVKPGRRPQWIQPVYIDDLAAAVTLMLELEEAANETFEIGGDRMTMDDVIATMLRVLGKRRPVVSIPVPLAKLGTLPLLLLPRPPMTPGGIDFVVQDGLVDTSKLERVLGIRPRSLESGLREYLVG